MVPGQNTFPLHSLFKSSLPLAEAAIEPGHPLHITYRKVILLQTAKSEHYCFTFLHTEFSLLRAETFQYLLQENNRLQV